MGKDVAITANSRVHTYSIQGHQWRQLTRKFKAYSRSRNLGCWMAEYGECLFHGEPIDYTAPPQSAKAFETDHFKPRHTHPHLMYVWDNLRASHSKCNRSRQTREVKNTVPHHDPHSATVGANNGAAQTYWVRPTW